MVDSPSLPFLFCWLWPSILPRSLAGHILWISISGVNVLAFACLPLFFQPVSTA